MGSSANFQNISIFLQSNASLAIEPRYPQLCQEVPVFEPPKNGLPSPVAVSQLLNSVASSLSFRIEDEISIFHLILESRHFSLQLWNCMQFWTCSLLLVAVTLFLAEILLLPPFLTSGQTLYLSAIFVPLLSLSLLGANMNPNVMNLSTGKNIIVVDAAAVKYALWCYGSRFLPTIAVLLFSHLLSVIDINTNCQDSLNHPGCSLPFSNQVHLIQHANLAATMVFLVSISLSFIFRDSQLWQKHPKNNLLWFKVVSLLVLIQVLYSLVAIMTDESSMMDWNAAIVPLQVWAVWLVGIFLVIGINEGVKRQEIKVEVRHQKRQRLEFGTKLGMNSPF